MRSQLASLAIFFLSLCAFFPTASQAQILEVAGTVYEDTNRNGEREPGEPGIAGVMVSNQRDVTLTDACGDYKLGVDGDTILFVSQPAGYRSPVSENGNPLFYYLHRPNGSPASYYRGIPATGKLPEKLDFALHKVDAPDNFKIVVFGDPQTETSQEIGYFCRDILEELVGTDASFIVALGDIMFDHLDLWRHYDSAIGAVGTTVFNVPGNHDVNYDAKEDRHSLETFSHHYGPPYYSFDFGQVHFVVLDSICHFMEDGNPKYEARLGERQIEWLKNDLALVPDEKLVVLMSHAPIHTRVSRSKRAVIQDRQALFMALAERPHVLALAGHLHTNEHHMLGADFGWHGPSPIHQIVCVAACGSWWSGPRDERGIPASDMRDGVPNGYQILEFSGANYTSTFKAAGRPISHQMRIHSPVGTYSDDEIEKERVLVNVFDTAPGSKAFFRVDRGEFAPMANTPEVDPLARRWFEDRWSCASKPWVDAVVTNNIWSAPVPALESGMHSVTVRTVDQYGRTFESSSLFMVW